MGVPEVLISGNHKQIAGFQEETHLVVTQQRRPEILDRAGSRPADIKE
jgi:tRNA G37 N-methylase TrmD